MTRTEVQRVANVYGIQTIVALAGSTAFFMIHIYMAAALAVDYACLALGIAITSSLKVSRQTQSGVD
jgi:hypothetical protein